MKPKPIEYNDQIKTIEDLVQFELEDLSGKNEGKKGYMLCSDCKAKAVFFFEAKKELVERKKLPKWRMKKVLRDIDEAIEWLRKKNLEKFKNGF